MDLTANISQGFVFSPICVLIKASGSSEPPQPGVWGGFTLDFDVNPWPALCTSSLSPAEAELGYVPLLTYLGVCRCPQSAKSLKWSTLVYSQGSGDTMTCAPSYFTRLHGHVPSITKTLLRFLVPFPSHYCCDECCKKK